MRSYTCEVTALRRRLHPLQLRILHRPNNQEASLLHDELAHITTAQSSDVSFAGQAPLHATAAAPSGDPLHAQATASGAHSATMGDTHSKPADGHATCMHESPWSAAPADVLAAVARQLGCQDLVAASGACCHWRSTLVQARSCTRCQDAVSFVCFVVWGAQCSNSMYNALLAPPCLSSVRLKVCLLSPITLCRKLRSRDLQFKLC